MIRFVFIIFAILIGIMPGFFIIFNYLFSDANGSIVERLMSFSIVLIVYSLLGLFFGIIRPKGTWHWGLWLNIAALFIVLLYCLKEPTTLLLGILYLAISLFSASMGAYYGSEYRAKRNR